MRSSATFIRSSGDGVDSLSGSITTAIVSARGEAAIGVPDEVGKPGGIDEMDEVALLIEVDEGGCGGCACACRSSRSVKSLTVLPSSTVPIRFRWMPESVPDRLAAKRSRSRSVVLPESASVTDKANIADIGRGFGSNGHRAGHSSHRRGGRTGAGNRWARTFQCMGKVGVMGVGPRRKSPSQTARGR